MIDVVLAVVLIVLTAAFLAVMATVIWDWWEGR